MDLNKILMLKQFNAINFDNKDGEILIYGELIETNKTCPVCKTVAIKPHQYHEKKVRTIPFYDMPTYLLFTHTAYLCPKCNKRFLEKVDFFEKSQRHTIAYEEYIWKLAKKQDISRVSELEGLSWNTANEIFFESRKKQEKSIDKRRK